MEHPILFSGPMVRAILDGTKTQTRRAVKPQPRDVPDGSYVDAYNHTSDWCFWSADNRLVNSVGPIDKTCMWRCPYGKPGDLLWVRETWAKRCADAEQFGTEEVLYKATSMLIVPPAWKPSIHMPRWASRITLRVTDVRVQRVQEISEEDAIAEGCRGELRGDTIYPPHAQFAELWDSINAKRGHSWESNPWVWAVTFERVTP